MAKTIVRLDRIANGHVDSFKFATDLEQGTFVSLNALNDNDIFVFKTNGENIFKFWVYNRYGGLVYKTESKSIVWNGKSSSGEDLNSGVYYYVIESDATDKHHNTAGVIHIFRE